MIAITIWVRHLMSLRGWQEHDADFELTAFKVADLQTGPDIDSDCVRPTLALSPVDVITVEERPFQGRVPSLSQFIGL